MPFHQDVHETIMAELRLADDGCPHADTERNVIEQYGYACDETPIDTLMANKAMGFEVAHNMAYGDEAYEQ